MGRQRCFVLSLILESQTFDLQVSKTTKLIFAWFLLKEVCVLETFQFVLFTFLRDRRMSYHSTDCLLLKSIFFQLWIFVLDVTNIKNYFILKCWVDKGVLSLILESQSFDDKCLKQPSLYLLDSLLKEGCVLETFQFGLFTFLRDGRMSYHSTDCLLLKCIFFQL